MFKKIITSLLVGAFLSTGLAAQVLSNDPANVMHTGTQVFSGSTTITGTLTLGSGTNATPVSGFGGHLKSGSNTVVDTGNVSTYLSTIKVVTVANQTARFALTGTSVNVGDYVRQTDTGGLYSVVNTGSLSSNSGYQQFAPYLSGTSTADKFLLSGSGMYFDAGGIYDTSLSRYLLTAAGDLSARYVNGITLSGTGPVILTGSGGGVVIGGTSSTLTVLAGSGVTLSGTGSLVVNGSGTIAAGSAAFQPASAFEPAGTAAGVASKLVTVANQTARFLLSSGSMHVGDFVKQTDTGDVFSIINTGSLANANGYQVYLKIDNTTNLVSKSLLVYGASALNDDGSASFAGGAISFGSDGSSLFSSLALTNSAFYVNTTGDAYFDKVGIGSDGFGYDLYVQNATYLNGEVTVGDILNFGSYRLDNTGSITASSLQLDSGQEFTSDGLYVDNGTYYLSGDGSVGASSLTIEGNQLIDSSGNITGNSFMGLHGDTAFGTDNGAFLLHASDGVSLSGVSGSIIDNAAGAHFINYALLNGGTVVDSSGNIYGNQISLGGGAVTYDGSQTFASDNFAALSIVDRNTAEAILNGGNHTVGFSDDGTVIGRSDGGSPGLWIGGSQVVDSGLNGSFNTLTVTGNYLYSSGDLIVQPSGDFQVNASNAANISSGDSGVNLNPGSNGVYVNGVLLVDLQNNTYGAWDNVQSFTPVTSGTVNVSSSGRNITVALNHSATIASLVMRFPTGSAVGQNLKVSTVNAVTALNISSNPLVGVSGTTSLSAGGYIGFVFDGTNWRRVQ